MTQIPWFIFMLAAGRFLFLLLPAVLASVAPFSNLEKSCKELLKHRNATETEKLLSGNINILKCWNILTLQKYKKEFIAVLPSLLIPSQKKLFALDLMMLERLFVFCEENNIPKPLLSRSDYASIALINCNERLLSFLLNGESSEKVLYTNYNPKDKKDNAIFQDKLQYQEAFRNPKARLWYIVYSPLSIFYVDFKILLSYFELIGKALVESDSGDLFLWIIRMNTLIWKSFPETKRSKEFMNIWNDVWKNVANEFHSRNPSSPLKQLFPIENKVNLKAINTTSYLDLIRKHLKLWIALILNDKNDWGLVACSLVEVSRLLDDFNSFADIKGHPLFERVEKELLECYYLQTTAINDYIPNWLGVWSKSLHPNVARSLEYASIKLRLVSEAHEGPRGHGLTYLTKTRYLNGLRFLQVLCGFNARAYNGFMTILPINENAPPVAATVLNLVPTKEQRAQGVAFSQIITNRSYHLLCSAKRSNEIASLISQNGKLRFLTDGMRSSNPSFIYYWVVSLFEKAFSEGVLIVVDHDYVMPSPDISPKCAFAMGALSNKLFLLDIADPIGNGLIFHPQFMEEAHFGNADDDSLKELLTLLDQKSYEELVAPVTVSSLEAQKGKYFRGRDFLNEPQYDYSQPISPELGDDQLVQFQGKPLDATLKKYLNGIGHKVRPQAAGTYIINKDDKLKILKRNWSKVIRSFNAGLLPSRKSVENSHYDYGWMKWLMTPCVDKSAIANAIELFGGDVDVVSLSGDQWVKPSRLIKEFILALSQEQLKIFVEVLVGSSLNRYAFERRNIKIVITESLEQFEAMSNPFTTPPPEDLQEIPGELHLEELQKIYNVVWHAIESTPPPERELADLMELMEDTIYPLKSYVQRAQVMILSATAHQIILTLAAAITREGYHANFSFSGQHQTSPTLCKDLGKEIEEKFGLLEEIKQRKEEKAKEKEERKKKERKRQFRREKRFIQRQRIKGIASPVNLVLFHFLENSVVTVLQEEEIFRGQLSHNTEPTSQIDNAMSILIDKVIEPLKTLKIDDGKGQKTLTSPQTTSSNPTTVRVQEDQYGSFNIKEANPWRAFDKPCDTRANPRFLKVGTYNAYWLFNEIRDIDGFPWRTPKELEEHQMEVAKELLKLEADIIIVTEVQNLFVLNKVIRFMHTFSGNQVEYFAYCVDSDDTLNEMIVGVITKMTPIKAPTTIDNYVEPPAREAYPIEGFSVNVPWPNGVVADPSGAAVAKNLVAHFEISSGERLIELAIVGIHLRAGTHDAHSIAYREAQALIVRDAVRELQNLGYLVIVAGDFNDFDELYGHRSERHTGSRTLRIIQEAGLLQTNWAFPKNKKFTHRKGTTIDHILSSRELMFSGFEIVKPFSDLEDLYTNNHDPVKPLIRVPSDHFGVVATFDLLKHRPSKRNVK